MHRRLALAAALALTACAPAAHAPGSDSYVGLRHPPLPAGVEELGGYVIGGFDFEYAVGHFREGSRDMLWLERLIRHDEAGNPYFETLAVLPLPAMGEGEQLALGTCSEGGVADGGDGHTVAVVAWTDEPVLTDVRHAWRVDPERRRFTRLDARRVQCVNEGYDL